MTRTIKFLVVAVTLIVAACIAPTPASAQHGYGPPPRITCSSNDGNRTWCDIGPSRDVRLVRQISGSACIKGSTWGTDRRGLWVDRGCRAEFVVAAGGPPPPQYGGGAPRIVTCSSNNGNRNWCDIGPNRDVRLARQISGSACIQGSTWGVDRRGLWVDRGCRGDFKVR